MIECEARDFWIVEFDRGGGWWDPLGWNYARESDARLAMGDYQRNSCNPHRVRRMAGDGEHEWQQRCGILQCNKCGICKPVDCQIDNRSMRPLTPPEDK